MRMIDIAIACVFEGFIQSHYLIIQTLNIKAWLDLPVSNRSLKPEQHVLGQVHALKTLRLPTLDNQWVFINNIIPQAGQKLLA